MNVNNSQMFYGADEIATILNVSKSKAYRLIKELNNELSRNGYITIAGKVPVKFFSEKLYC